MNTTNAIVKLLTTYQPKETVLVRKTERKPEGVETRTRNATVIQRRPNADAPATIAELVDAFIQASGIQFALREGETPVGHAFKLAEQAGKIVIKRDKNGSTGSDNDIPRAVWLAQDAPVRKRKAKGDKIREAHERRMEVLASLGLAPTPEDVETAARLAEDEDEDAMMGELDEDEDNG